MDSRGSAGDGRLRFWRHWGQIDRTRDVINSTWGRGEGHDLFGLHNTRVYLEADVSP